MIFLYAFVAVLCLGLAPLFGKIALHNTNPATALIIRTFIAAALVSFWLLTTKNCIDLTELTLFDWLIIGMEAVLGAVLGELAYFYALEKGNVFEIAVIMSCTPLVTIALGSLFFSQPLSLKQLTGAIVVTVGLMILLGD
jgi:transporter family protein